MLVPVILSGGAGARLWPVSREAYPKPFIRLPDGGSLLQRTLARVGRVEGVSRIVTVTNREYYFLTKDGVLYDGRTYSYFPAGAGRT
jgi:mannose-1-phosphate guanylyltransferase/mannose-6-phosphate isomerase